MKSDPSKSSQPSIKAEEPLLIERAIGAWNRFWFTPSDPTILSFIRLCCGLLTVYTLGIYTLELQNFFGKDAYLNLDVRIKQMRETPWSTFPWNWPINTPKDPPIENEDQRKYVEKYKEVWKEPPPLPHPRSQEEIDHYNRFRAYWGDDARKAYAIGAPEWSIWFHVTDPRAMLVIHWCFLIAAVFFTLGLGTRVTSVITWFAFMCYVHRSPVTLFGVDTMNLILLVYLMIGPSGAAFSLDRVIARWWCLSGFAKFQRFFRRGKVQPVAVQYTVDRTRWPFVLEPSVTATIAIRCLQIHLCIIYAAAGLSKLQGQTWWAGTAIWSTLTNPEFAPMHNEWYIWILRRLASNQLIINLLLVTGTWATLFFEISYPFLIWNKHTRWLMLTLALLLHGFIALFMGLKTFALMMLVMNMGFLPKYSLDWFLRLPQRWRKKGIKDRDAPQTQSTVSTARPTVIRPPQQMPKVVTPPVKQNR